MSTSDPDVQAQIDRLYESPLSDFIAARNALAARLKSEGDKEGASRVRALARPNVPAWAVNQAYWTARPEFDAFVMATQGLRSAQAERATGAELREAMTRRREAQGVVSARAASLLVAAGHGTGADTLRRVSDILEAVAAAPASSVGDRVQLGRLVGDLEPPGFDAIGAFVPPGSQAPALDRRSTVGSLDHGKPLSGPASAESGPRASTGPADDPPDERAIALESARVALAETERTLERARREAREAADTQAVIEKRGQEARDELAEATRRYQSAQERAAFAAAAEAAARDETARRAGARDAAEAAHDAALRAVRALSIDIVG